MADSIAQIIYQQLGGSRFAYITGSKNFINTGKGLRFSFGRNKTSSNRCYIEYDEGLDLYNVTFSRFTQSKKTFETKEKVQKEYHQIYCDQLQELFTSYTGLVTSLF